MKQRFGVRLRQACVASLGFAVAAACLHVPANAFFIIIPIPRIKTPPGNIDATAEQRKLAMCAAFHKGVIDTDIDGKRKDSWRGDIVNTALVRMSEFPEAKKLIGSYLWQWEAMQKQNFESGQAYGLRMIDACGDARLPVEQVQYDYWQSMNPHAEISDISVGDIPAQPLKLDGLVTSADYPAGFKPDKSSYATGVTLQIDREGKVVDCFVEEESGSEEIDDATCELLMARAKFRPAIEDGMPAVFEYPYTQTWPMP